MNTLAASALAASLWLALLIVGTELLMRLWRGRRERSAAWALGVWHAAAGLGLMLALQAAVSGSPGLLVLAALAGGGLAHAMALRCERRTARGRTDRSDGSGRTP